MTLIILSRIAVDACGLFLEAMPEEALHDADHDWWKGEERDLYLETMRRTIVELRPSPP